MCGSGHAHPVIAAAIAEQAATLVHTSNLFEMPWQTAAAQKLAEVSGMEEIFFSNSVQKNNRGVILVFYHIVYISQTILKQFFLIN